MIKKWRFFFSKAVPKCLTAGVAWYGKQCILLLISIHALIDNEFKYNIQDSKLLVLFVLKQPRIRFRHYVVPCHLAGWTPAVPYPAQGAMPATYA